MVYLYKYKLKKAVNSNSLVFIRDALERHFPKESGEIEVFKDERGKPVTDREDIKVSATHTGNIVICAISSRELGVDAQSVREGTKIERIAARFFTENEQVRLKAGGDEAFYEIWCRKEAFSKLAGRGIAYGLKNIETVEVNGEYCTLIKGERIIGGKIPEGYFALAGGEGDFVWIEIEE